ncbi:MAG: hypothetical protein LBB14_03650 [Puniceicoccales bacterium]|jgi:diaminopimelate epimerase|nr:hypothetical protein [Puniceicoccales bacterium]
MERNEGGALYDALGNRFLALPPDRGEPEPAEVRRLCRLRRCDGLLAGRREGPSQFALTVVNRDGSPAETSGNGVRIYAKFLADCALVGGAECVLRPPAGPVRCTFESDGTVSALLGPCSIEPETLTLPSGPLAGYRASVGNPHFVALANPPDWRRIAREIVRHFPAGINVEFARQIGPNSIHIKNWERGVGETTACGSGAACCGAVFFRRRALAPPLYGKTAGGTVKIIPEGNFIRISGPIRRLC